ncbi:MAG: hypothetical protein ABGY96_22085 [bacterium]|nr:hypothetical protein [Gammaproteobacteria bacterium]HIL98076.1 hypothetical protein [Pseudomonadales bacterium]
MQILTINLPTSLSDAITCELGEIVCRTNHLSEAFDQLQNEDFDIVVCCISPQSISYQSLETLIGLTLISTRIILVGESDKLADYMSYNELGIELLAGLSREDLVNRIRSSAEPETDPVQRRSLVND